MLYVPLLISCSESIVEYIHYILDCCIVAESGTPTIRSLETLHNALSLKQLDSFLQGITTSTPSPPR